MAGEDHIADLLGTQAPVDESTLPDSGTTDADLGSSAIPESDTGGDPLELGTQQDPGQKRVPLGALQEERTRRQQLQDQLNQQTQLNQRMQERFNEMMLRLQQPQQPAPHEPAVEIPAFIDDPEGHINGLRQQLTRELEQVKQFQQQVMTQQQAGQQGQELARHVAAEEAKFAAETPDYSDAANFFMQRKAVEYQALGLDPVSIQMQLQRDYQGLAVAAVQRGENPAKMLYNLSRAMGYAGQQAQQGTQRPAPQQQVAKPAPTSLSNVGGAPMAPDEGGALTLEAVANMTDAEFDRYWKQMERGSRQRPKI